MKNFLTFTFSRRIVPVLSAKSLLMLLPIWTFVSNFQVRKKTTFLILCIAFNCIFIQKGFSQCTPINSPTITLSATSIPSGGSVNLTASASSGIDPNTVYSWASNVGSFSSTTSSPTLTIPNIKSGLLTVTVNMVSGDVCTAMATATVSVTATCTVTNITACTGKIVTLTADAGLINLKWYKNNALIIGANALTYDVTTAGSYYYSGTDPLTNCTAEQCCPVAVTFDPTPSATATGGNICVGKSIDLTAGGGGTYLWSGPATISNSNTANPTVTSNIAGTQNYTVTVTNSFNCTATASAAVVVNPNPVTVASGGTICAGKNIDLTATGGGSYAWAGPATLINSTAANPTVTSNTAGTQNYSVTVTNSFGCTTTGSTAVIINPVPVATIAGGTICSGDNINLTATGGTNYFWTGVGLTSNNVASPTVTLSGSTPQTQGYTVVVTNGFGCSTSLNTQVQMNTLPIPNAYGGTICSGQNINLTASGGNGYAWSGSGLAQTNVASPTVTLTSAVPLTSYYTVTITNANNCAATTSTSVLVNTSPTPTATGGTICSGQSIVLTATGGFAYSWSGVGLTSTNNANPTVTTASGSSGTQVYSVTVTSPNNCTATATTNVTILATPVVTALGGSICSGSTITLTATGGGTYSWTGVGLTSTNVANPTVTLSSGTTQTQGYTVTVVNGSCTSTASTTVKLDPNPVASAMGGVICSGQSITLSTSGGGASYAWSGLGLSASNVANPIVTLSGVSSQTNIYSVTISYAGGCTSSATTQVTMNPNPVASATGGTICSGQSILLTATGGTTYAWSGLGLSNSNTANPSVTLSNGATVTQNYTVTVTNGSNCTASATTNVLMNPSPVVTVTGGTICSGNSVQLSATGGGTYSWTGTGLSSTNIANPTVTLSSGTPQTQGYTVSVVIGNCVTTATTAVVLNPNPVASAMGGTICSGQSITLSTSGGGASYTWSGIGLSASNVANPIVTLSGVSSQTNIYSVTITYGGGCTSSATTQVTMNPTPVASATGGTICSGQSILLTATGGTTYAWSGLGLSNSNTANPSVTLSGSAPTIQNYTVIVTNSSNCTASATTNVLMNPSPVVTVTGGTICSGNSVQLSATGGGSYSWAGTGLTSTSVANPTVTLSSGTTQTQGYTVTVVNGSCSSTASTTVKLDPNPVASATGGVICAGNSILLTATPGGANYSWTGIGLTNSTTANPTVTLTGIASRTETYSVTVVNVSGCTSSATTTVRMNPNPIPTALGGTICAGKNISLTATGSGIGGSYAWAGTGLLASSGANPTVTLSGTASTTNIYTVTATNSNNCTATATTTVVMNPNPSITVIGGQVCSGNTITMTATGGGNYAWAGVGLTSTNVANPNVFLNGAIAQTQGYTVTVSNGFGCTTTGNTTVIMNLTPIATATGGTLCAGKTVTLGSTGGGTYAWAGSGLIVSNVAAPMVTLTGLTTQTRNYTVTVTDPITFCSATATTTVTMYPNPLPTALGGVICAGQNINLTATAGTSYVWSGNGLSSTSGANPTVTLTGASTLVENYLVTATDVNGCSATATTTVKMNPNPVVQISGGQVCSGATLALTATGGTTYAWTGQGLTTTNVASPDLILFGLVARNEGYTVTVTDANGCVTTANTSVQMYPNPIPTANGGTICSGKTITMSATGGISYAWSGTGLLASSGANPTVTLSGVLPLTENYTVKVTDVNTCTATATTTVKMNPNPVVVTAGGIICSGKSINLTASGGTVYQWAGVGLSATSGANPTVTLSGAAAQTQVYTVTVTDALNCSTTASTQVVMNPNPVPIATGGVICSGKSLSLTATNGNSYVWAGTGLMTTTGANPTVSLSGLSVQTQFYTVTATDVNGCSTSVTTSVLMNPNPTIAINTNNVCVGQTLNFTATTNNGNQFAWDRSFTGGIFNSIAASPLASHQGVSAGTHNYSVTVTNTLLGCSATGSASVVVRPLPTVTAIPSVAYPCEYGDLTLMTINSPTAVTYLWAGPASFTSTVAKPLVGFLNLSQSGVYSVTVADVFGCTNSSSINIEVTRIPAVTLLAPAVCEGEALNISTTTTNGINFKWSGADGFTSTLKNPSRNNATTAMSGVYTVTAVSLNFCETTATVSVTVKPKAVINTSASPVCEQATLTLTSTVTNVSTYAWTGPSFFTSTLASPTRTGVTDGMAGIYNVTATALNGCSASSSVLVTVLKLPVINPLAGNVCEGQSLGLSASGGVSYLWSNGAFLSTLANPTVSNSATLAMNGIYSVVVTGTNACSASATVAPLVRPNPSIGLTASGSVCVGTRIDLSVTGGNSYVWAGPAGFSSTLNAPSREPATVAMTGQYSVTALGSNACSATATIAVKVNVPEGTIAGPQTICEGNTLQLSAAGGGTYNWSGQNNFSSTLATPTLPNALVNASGVYSVTITGTNSCSVLLTQTATVNKATATAISNSPLCVGSALNMTATGGGLYQWAGPEGFSSTLSMPIIATTTLAKAGGYSVIVTATNGCTATASTSVVINQQGASAAPVAPLCEGGTINLNTNTGTGYTWAGPSNFNSTLQSPVLTNATQAMAGVYTVTVIGSNNCSGTATANVVVNANPLPILGNNASAAGIVLCNTQTINLSATGGATYQWSGPNNFSSTLQNPIIANSSTDAKGTYSVTVLNLANCSAVATTSLSVKLCEGSIGDFVWKDLDQNGIQSANENGVENLRVELYTVNSIGNLSASPVAVQFTKPNGSYLFDKLKSDNYKVLFVWSTLPNGCYPTKANQGLNDELDSDADETTGLSPVIQIDATKTGILKDNLTIDAGVITPYGSIGDFVWKEVIENGQQDANEKGVRDIKVELFRTDINGNLLSNTPIKTKLTDANGKYLFDSLGSGNYKVKFTVPSTIVGCFIIDPNVGDDATDSDADKLTGFSQRVSIDVRKTGIDRDNLTIDAGLITKFASLGDYVWKDFNRNGIQDLGEKGLKDFQVELYQVNSLGQTGLVPLATAVTDLNGYYNFPNLLKGEYKVKFILASLPAECDKITKANQGLDDALDSDADPITGFSPQVSLDPLLTGLAKNNPTIDAGITPKLGSIGDIVWKDENHDGIQDTKETTYISNVTVQLYAIDPQQLNGIRLLETQKTDGNGKYLFKDLLPGDYKVKFDFTTLQANCLPTLKKQGTDRGIDSDADPITGFSEVISIDVTKEGTPRDNMTIDLGVYTPTGSIGDFVWKDTNNNSIQDTDELGVKNIDVYLFEAVNGALSGNAIAQTITNAAGLYLFKNLPLNKQYIVRFDLSTIPTDCEPVEKSKGTDPKKDSDANLQTGETLAATLTNAKPDVLDLDLGLRFKLGSIGDYVWKDANRNGKQDSEELGVKNIIVELYKTDAAGVPEATAFRTTKTDLNGKYLFDSLKSGNYKVKFQNTNLPADCNKYTQANQGNDLTQDSDANPITGFSQIVVIDVKGTPAQRNNRTIDAGLIAEFASLGDYVWKDMNRNGLQDSDEKGLKDFKVELYQVDSQGKATLLNNTLTDKDGYYVFTGLSKGDYKVKFITTNLPSDCDKLTTANAGTNDAIDSDADPITGFSQVVSIDPLLTNLFKNNPTLDAGITPKLGSIGDIVWKDENQNGIQDLNETTFVSNVTVQLYQLDASQANGLKLLQTQKTDVNGKYLFKDLPSGDYKVKFDYTTLEVGCLPTTINQGNNDALDSDADPETGFSQVVTLDIARGGVFKDNLTVDLGLITPRGSIGDYVWKDANNNGTQDNTELGVPNIKVYLYEAINGGITGGPLAVTATNNGGGYIFQNLKLGKSYIVKFDLSTIPSDCEVIEPFKGLDSRKDSDANTLTGESKVVSLTINKPDNFDIDMGIKYKYGSIGDYVWKDANKNGLQDGTEKGLENVIVELYRVDANGNTGTLPMFITRSNANGKYLFDSLRSGSYKVKFQTIGLPKECGGLTDPTKGTNTGLDSDANTITGFSAVVVIDVTGTGIQRNNPTIDAGYLSIDALALGCPSDGGPDQRLCHPETTTKLYAANVKQIWSVFSGPALASITQSGQVTGITKRGTYRFILTGFEDGIICRDTVLVRKNILEVADFATCESLANLPGANAGQAWSVLPGNPSPATVTQSGLVVGLTKVGVYKFLIQNPSCSDTAVVVKLPAPTFEATTLQATCIDTKPNTDAKIIVSEYQAGSKADYSVGNVYIGTKTATTALLVPDYGILANNLPSPSTGKSQTYTIRLWSPAGCYTDQTVILYPTSCACPEPKCVPFVIKRSK